MSRQNWIPSEGKEMLAGMRTFMEEEEDEETDCEGDGQLELSDEDMNYDVPVLASDESRLVPWGGPGGPGRISFEVPVTVARYESRLATLGAPGERERGRHI